MGNKISLSDFDFLFVYVFSLTFAASQASPQQFEASFIAFGLC